MARNAEKAQSMLYRFREAKAQELGLATKTDKRPRIASTCRDLRQCERWRGEILREISRKVSKIQDDGLTDYEVRDLNDEINKLLREKYHWENQIVALGGANYRHAVPKMKDSQGKEVPGIRGYKYFGRAKDLPGVKELFESKTKTAGGDDEENKKRFDMYRNVESDYYGDFDEQDPELLAFEREEEEEAWKADFADMCEKIGLPEDTEAPPLPEPKWVVIGGEGIEIEDENKDQNEDQDTQGDDTTTKGKRKGASTKKGGDGKRQRLDEDANKKSNDDNQTQQTKINTVLDPAELLPPKLPTADEMENLIIGRQKKELLEEYAS